MQASRLGVIDIGSNSVRFVVYEVYGASFTAIYNEKVLAGLGRDLNRTGRLHEEGCRLAFAALKRFKILADTQNLTDVLIAADGRPCAMQVMPKVLSIRYILKSV